MEYTIKKLAELAGVTTRTLRYYDEINILKPARINSSGYRIYGKAEVNKLQQIMFYRELGVELDVIKSLISSSSFNNIEALKGHRKKLLDKKKQLELLINNVEKTISATEGRNTMSDKEKFEGFKKKMVEENEKNHGQEIREKYGEEAIKGSNKKILNMSKEDYERIEELNKKLNHTLKLACEDRNPESEIAQDACQIHKEWLCFHWKGYSKEAHMELAQMYVDDERFAEYYNKIYPGCAVFLRDAMKIFTGVGDTDGVKTD